MQINPTCPRCRRPQSTADPRDLYDIIDYENGPSQVFGELGPSPGGLARNSRAYVARRVLATMNNMLAQDRTRTGDTDVRLVRMEHDKNQETSQSVHNDIRNLGNEIESLCNHFQASNAEINNELDTLRVYFWASNAENIQLYGQAIQIFELGCRSRLLNGNHCTRAIKRFDCE